MKRKLWIVFMLAALVTAMVWCGTAMASQSGMLTSTISWTLDDAGALTITGSGAIPDYSRTNRSPFKNSLGIQTVTIGEGITRIGASTFSSCSTIKEVLFPFSLTSIRTEAFYSCSGLTAIQLPGRLTTIGRYAFGKTGLTNVVIPGSVTDIGEYSFYNCANLKKATVLKFSASFGDEVFGASASGFLLYGWPGSATETYAADNSYSFSGAVSGSCGENVTFSFDPGILKKLTIRGTGPMTDYDVFNSCLSPFHNNESINCVVIESGVTHIGNDAFNGCSMFGGVSIPSGVGSIGIRAFENCVGLAEVILPTGVTDIGEFAFCNITGLTSVTIPDGVTSIGAATFMDCVDLQYVTLPDSLRTIGNVAFSGCNHITGIAIPDGVTTIGTAAFFDSTGLTSITIPASVTRIDKRAFNSCSSLTSVSILNPDCSIGDTDYNEFRNCASGLVLYGYSGSTTETYAAAAGIPFRSLMGGSCGDNVTWAFIETTGELIISGTGPMANYSGDDMPWSSVKNQILTVFIGKGVTTVGNYAFYYCNKITSVTLPETLQTIGSNAFRYCFALEAIILPDSLTRISDYAFYNCSQLTELTIPAGVTYLGNQALRYCGKLHNITVLNRTMTFSMWPLDESAAITLHGYSGSTAQTYANKESNVTFAPIDITGSCGPNAFYSYDTYTRELTITGSGGITSPAWGPGTSIDNILSVKIEYGITNIDNYCFKECFELSSVTIPNSMNRIGVGAFQHCGALTSITIPDSVTELEDLAFYGCGLTSVTIGSGVTSIGINTFYYCNNLSSVTIGSSVTSIGQGAFYGCTILNSVTFPDSLTSIGERAFSNCIGLTSVTFPNNLTSIGPSAFYTCTGLTSVTFPDSVTSIGYEAFSCCASLNSVTVLNPYCTIGATPYDVFDTCSSDLVLHGYIGSTAQTYAANAHHAFEPLEVPAPTFILPAGLTAIEAEAFQGIRAIAVQIPASVTEINGNPFADSLLYFVYGYTGSAAETFANHYGYIFVPITE